MNNYILNSGSCSYNNHTYNYIETNNHYVCPYVFMTNDNVALKYVYFKNMPDETGGEQMGYRDSDGYEELDVTTINYSIKAWGATTIAEATIIGSGSSDSSQLIIKNELETYNCKLKDETIIDYADNQCINYMDIEKDQPTGGTVILCYFYGGIGIAGGGYIHATGSSLLFESIRTFTIKYDNGQITEDSTYPNTSIGPMHKSGVTFDGIKTTHIVEQHPESHIVNSFAIDKFSYNTTFKESHTYLLTGTYHYIKGTHTDGDIIREDGSKTGYYLNLNDCYFSPNFALTNEDYNLILNACHNDTAFYGDGTMENPYRIYFHIEELS